MDRLGVLSKRKFARKLWTDHSTTSRPLSGPNFPASHAPASQMRAGEGHGRPAKDVSVSKSFRHRYYISLV